jgi:single-stranded-DNA-specific exonuclease
MTEKRWVQNPLPDAQIVENLKNSINVSTSIATLLAMRGVNTFDEAKAFFRPSLDQIHDPFLMKDMDLAVARLEKAIAENEKIMIYGDYDVDGTTSVSMMYHFLKTNVYEGVSFYIPDRYKEGYGVQKIGIDFASDNDISLIICIDCGIKSVELIAYAKSIGIDFIVCDHHRPGEILPPAVAVLDPKRSDCNYPFDELTGCGVGFKLLSAFCEKNKIDQALLLPYLDLVATSIACDIVPVNGENRVLAYFGLQFINQNPRTGVKALINATGLKKIMNITDVVFGLGPRINAAGRISHAYDAVNLLLSDDEEESLAFSKIVNEHNINRKGLDANITIEALQMIEANDEQFGTKYSTVLFKNDWHKGVIGIVASRCIEKYHRPTIILMETNGHAAGSARSVPGFDIYDAIEACSEHLIQFGGHAFAAGLTVEIDKIPDFILAFEREVASRILPEQQNPIIKVDLPLNFTDLDDKFVRIMNQMAPFGPKNMTPIFVADNVKLKGEPRILKEKHLKIAVYQTGSLYFDAIGFGMVDDFYEGLKNCESFSLCFQIEINEFRGEKKIQLMIKDIKF